MSSNATNATSTTSTTSTSKATSPTTANDNKVGMDRKIVKKHFLSKKIMLALSAIVVIGVLAQAYLPNDQGKTFSIGQSRLIISNVKSGTFEDFIPVRSRVTPLKTLYLDAVEGGRVEKVLVEDGTILAPGQAIVLLSNTQLQLDVMRNEAAVTEQLNNMRSIELSLEQNRLSHKRNLVDFDYQIKRLTRKVAREQAVYQSGSISGSVLSDSEDLLEYNHKRRVLTLESQKTDALMQEQQLSFLKATGERLEKSLVFARQNMDNLNMKAPVAGKLSGFDVEVGQSISRGERIGQIDDPSAFKLKAGIDEFYLERVSLNQQASITRNGEDYPLTIAKIYPQVNNGQFQVDLTFTGKQPTGIRRGQTMQTKLTLGDSSQVLLIPNGAFYQDTGGNWVFVVTDDGKQAVKRNVRLGRKNNRYIEVLEGLQANEQVITSPYASFKEMDTLKLDKQS